MWALGGGQVYLKEVSYELRVNSLVAIFKNDRPFHRVANKVVPNRTRVTILPLLLLSTEGVKHCTPYFVRNGERH